MGGGEQAGGEHVEVEQVLVGGEQVEGEEVQVDNEQVEGEQEGKPKQKKGSVSRRSMRMRAELTALRSEHEALKRDHAATKDRLHAIELFLAGTFGGEGGVVSSGQASGSGAFVMPVEQPVAPAEPEPKPELKPDAKPEPKAEQKMSALIVKKGCEASS